MKNILENLEDVNIFYSHLWLNRLGLQIGEKPVFKKVESGNFAFVAPIESKASVHCPLQMDTFFINHDYTKERVRINPESKYPKIAQQAHNGSIKDITLKESVAKWADSVPLVCTGKEKDYAIFEGYAKSTKRYNIKNQWRIVDHAKTCEKAGLKPYFLTITNDPKHYWNNYIVAWKYFKKQCNRILKNVSRKFAAEYQIVYEAQRTGNPHAHAVLWLPSWVSDDVIVKYKKKEYISKGKLKDYLRKYEEFTGFMELRRGDKQNAVYYLCKYITKSATSDIKKISKDKNRLSIEDRKMLLTVFMPVLTQVRQFQVSQLKNIPDSAKSSSVALDRNANKRDLQASASPQTESFEQAKENCIGLTEEQAKAKLEPYLNMLCINLPKCSRSSVRLLSYGQFSRGHNISTEHLDKLSLEKRKELFASAKNIGCDGCILSDMLEFEDGIENFGYKTGVSFEEGELEAKYTAISEAQDLAHQCLHWTKYQYLGARKAFQKGLQGTEPETEVEPIHEKGFYKLVDNPRRLMMSDIPYKKWCHLYGNPQDAKPFTVRKDIKAPLYPYTLK